MARIKFVLNERRILYEGALKMFADSQAALETPKKPPVTVDERKKRRRGRLVKLMRPAEPVEQQQQQQQNASNHPEDGLK